MIKPPMFRVGNPAKRYGMSLDQIMIQNKTVSWWFGFLVRWINHYEQLSTKEYLRDNKGYRILSDLMKSESYEEVIAKESSFFGPLVTINNVGMYHNLIIDKSDVTLEYSSDTESSQTMFLSLMLTFCKNYDRERLYRLFKYLCENNNIHNEPQPNEISRNVYVISPSLVQMKYYYMRIEDGLVVTNFINNESVKISSNMIEFEYPKLDNFFGKLNGRKLTEEDVALYEMVHGHKPLFYNLEYKI